MKTTEQLQEEIPFLDVRLFDLGETPITVGTVVIMVAVLLAALLVSWLVTRTIRKAFKFRGVEDEGTVGVVSRLTHYLILGAGLFVALRVAGIDLSALFAAGAIFAVALGFAMQNITANFVSGVILLSERAIKPGDVLNVEGKLVRVRDMGIRATIVRTLDDEDLIIPNSVLVQSTVTNHTFRDNMMRLRVPVGVIYGSDMRLVQQVLHDTAEKIPWRSTEKKPVVLLVEFGNSSVDFEVSVWIEDPWKSRWGRSDLRQAIWWALKDAGITIAFPQLDLHLDEPVVESLQALRATA
jgi:small-conductance mechanosensitive channel